MTVSCGMARSAANIQAEIDRLETMLAAEDTDIKSAGSDGGMATRFDRSKLEARLDKLYIQLSRAQGTLMFIRGRVHGLR